jgi:hypothetical protein
VGVPALHLSESGSSCRLSLNGWASGVGSTLQDAADDLLARLLDIGLSIRASGFAVPSELGPPDHECLEFFWRIGDLAARGGDVRAFVFGSPDGDV